MNMIKEVNTVKTDVKPMVDYAREILGAVAVNNLDAAHNLILEQCVVHGQNPQMSIMALLNQLIANAQDVAVTLLAMQVEMESKNKQDLM